MYWDLDQTPPEFASKKTPTQADILTSVHNASQTAPATYLAVSERRRNLFEFRQMYLQSEAKKALKQLGQKYVLKLPKDYQQGYGSDDALFRQTATYLDFDVCVGHQGFDAFLPPEDAGGDLRFNMQLQLNQRHVEWRYKNAMLGADPKGRMLRIGSSGDVQVWSQSMIWYFI